MISSKLISRYRKEISLQLSSLYIDGPKTLTEPIQHVLKGKGKRIRPLLAIFSTEACGGAKREVLSAALAVEVLHNFTLVHDDIMDQDNIRHGQATVHQKWDEGTALLTGDAMLSLALRLINKSNQTHHLQMEKFIEGLLSVCEGQALDKEFETKKIVEIDEYIKMIDLKTGHMLGLAAELGAISANANNEICMAVRDYGRLIGRAFQIQDDYLEIFSDSINMGKTLKSDLLLSKKTFLMIHALNKNDNDINYALKVAQDDYRKGLNMVRNYMRKESIDLVTQEAINHNIELADKKILNLGIDSNKLLYFSELIKRRNN